MSVISHRQVVIEIRKALIKFYFISPRATDGRMDGWILIQITDAQI